MNIFGNWINDLSLIQNNFNSKFPHIIINNFLSTDYAEKVNKDFPKKENLYHKYNNPLEVKFSNNNIKEMTQEFKDIFNSISDKKILDILKKLTDINNLEPDSSSWIGITFIS